MPKKMIKRRTPDLGGEAIVYEKQSQICKAFANPVRLRIIDLISTGELSISDIQQELNISKANLSQHLTVLKNVGILAARRDGKHVLCSLAIPEVKQACHLVRKVLLAQVEGTRKMMLHS